MSNSNALGAPNDLEIFDIFKSRRDFQLATLNKSIIEARRNKEATEDIEDILGQTIDRGIFLYGVRKLNQITKGSSYEKSSEYFEKLRESFNERIVMKQNGDGSAERRDRPYVGCVTERELNYQLQLSS